MDIQTPFVRIFGPEQPGRPGHLWPRWLFLRALGLIFFSAFYSLAFQIEGLVGPQGILPAQNYLELLAGRMGILRFWVAPTLLWLGSAHSHYTCWCGPGWLLPLHFSLTSGRADQQPLRWWPIFHLSQPLAILLIINRMACYWRLVSCRSSLPRQDFVPALVNRARLHEPVCFCCNGNGFEFTLNPAWPNWTATIPNGVI